MITHLADPSNPGVALCGDPIVKLHGNGRRSVCVGCYPWRTPAPWPNRAARPYCSCCGMAEGHWPGCEVAA